MELNLLRISIDGHPVGRIDNQGLIHWNDLEALRVFCARYLSPSRLQSMRRGPVTEVAAASAMDINLISVGTADAKGSRTSVAFSFAVEDRRAPSDG